MGLNFPKRWFKCKAPKPGKCSSETADPIPTRKPKVTLELPSIQQAEDHVLLVEDESDEDTGSPDEPPSVPRLPILELEPDSSPFLGREEQAAIANLIYGSTSTPYEPELAAPGSSKLPLTTIEHHQCSIRISDQPNSVFHRLVQEAVHVNDSVFGLASSSGNEEVQSPMLADDEDVDVDVLMGAASQEMCIDEEGCEVSGSSIPTITWQPTSPDRYNDSRPPSYCQLPAYGPCQPPSLPPTNLVVTPPQPEDSIPCWNPQHEFSGRTSPLPMYTPPPSGAFPCEVLKSPDFMQSYDASRHTSVERVLSRRCPKYERDKWSTLHRITTKRRNRRHQPFPTQKVRQLKIDTPKSKLSPSIDSSYSSFKAWEGSVMSAEEALTSNTPSPDSPTASIGSDTTLRLHNMTPPEDGFLKQIQSMIQTLETYNAEYLSMGPAVKQVQVFDLGHAEGFEDTKSTTSKIEKLNKDVGELTAAISSAIMRDNLNSDVC